MQDSAIVGELMHPRRENAGRTLKSSPEWCLGRVIRYDCKRTGWKGRYTSLKGPRGFEKDKQNINMCTAENRKMSTLKQYKDLVLYMGGDVEDSGIQRKGEPVLCINRYMSKIVRLHFDY